MLPGKTYDVEDVIDIASRGKWLLCLTFLSLTLGSAILAYSLPSRWVSTAVISIVPQRVPESYVRSTVTIGPQDRLESIRRDILSRPRLEQIIREFNLYADARQAGLMDDVVNRMRNGDVRMALMKDDAFEVSFHAADPALARRVASRLASLFIDENIRQRTQLAEGSSEFLKSQLVQVKSQLETTEQRLQEYRRAHDGELPDQMPGNMQGTMNAQLQLQQLRESINRDRDRRMMVERQIADLSEVQAEPPSAELGNSASRSAPVLSAAERLAQASAHLSELEVRLKPEHPDVTRGRRVVADLQKEVDADLGAAPSAGAGRPPRTAAEAARRTRGRQLETELASIDRSIAGTQEEERRLQGISAQYQSRLDAAPMRQSELTALLRDYDIVATQYKDLLTNSKAAEMSEDLERRQGGEQFRLVEEARVPQRPASPNRPLIVGGGAAAGLALGLGLLALFEYPDGSLRRKEDVSVTLGLPVLAVVPVMTSARDRRARRVRTRLASSAAALLTVATVVAVWGALTR